MALTPLCHGKTHPATAQSPVWRVTAAPKVSNSTDGKRRDCPEQAQLPFCQPSGAGEKALRGSKFECLIQPKAVGLPRAGLVGLSILGGENGNPESHSKALVVSETSNPPWAQRAGWLSRAPWQLSASLIPQKPQQQFQGVFAGSLRMVQEP